MSLEWTYVGAIGTIFLPALGHLYHFLLAVNVSSGWGMRETPLARLRTVLLAALLGTAAWLLYAHLRCPWWTWAWPLRAYPLLCLISGGIVLPLASLQLAMRRRPSGISGRHDLVDLSEPAGPHVLIGQGWKSWQLRLPGNEAFGLCRREWELDVSGLPPALDGLSIIQLSDLHFAPCYDRGYFERVVQACRDWTADLVVITGDLVEVQEAIAWIEPVLGPLESRLGKFAILGNHDAEHDRDEILEALTSAGFESVDGHWLTILDSGARLEIGGTSAPWGPSPDAPDPNMADFRLLLSHSPDQFYRACQWGVDLVLSGHNHGGQVRLPAVGPLFMPSRYSRRFDRGFFRSGRSLLYVSEGVAGQHPYRYGCPPEVCRFVLRSA